MKSKNKVYNFNEFISKAEKIKYGHAADIKQNDKPSGKVDSDLSKLNGNGSNLVQRYNKEFINKMKKVKK